MPETATIDLGKVMTRIAQAKKDAGGHATHPSTKSFLHGYINALEDLLHYKKFDTEM